MLTVMMPGARWSPVYVLLLLGLLESGAGELKVAENRTESACFSSSDSKVLEASCPPAHMVYIVDLFYGHSTTGACAHTPGDCTFNDFLLPECVGRQKCQINLPSGDLGRKMPHCLLYSNYMQLVYKCIPEAEVHDVCAAGVLRAQTGYVRTPSYPNNYPASRACTTSVRVRASQRLRLHVVELDLEATPGGCSDLLYLQGHFRSSSLCGKRRHDNVFTTVGSALNLTFTSDEQGRKKGFWLYYEAFPYMEPTTHAPTTEGSTPRLTSVPTDTPPGVHTVLPPSGSTPQTVNTQPHGRIPLEAIVGGLLGSLLCILLVLLILLIIKRRKEREAIPSSTSTCFLHSNGRGGAPYIQNNLAMVDDSPMC